MKTSAHLSMILFCTLLVSHALNAQDADLPPNVPGDEATTSVLVAPEPEDIPPPEPIPTPTPSAATPQSGPAGVPEARMSAYDFGLSFEPGFQGEGLKVRGVVVGSIAQRTGLRPRDQIVAINEQSIVRAEDLARAPIQSVTVIRKGVQQTLTVDARGAFEQDPGGRYAAPRTTYSEPTRYRYSRIYPLGPPPVDYRHYYGGPDIVIGLGVGPRGIPGYVRPGFGGPGYGRRDYYYGRPSFYGPGYYRGRSGVNIRVGGFGISF